MENPKCHLCTHRGNIPGDTHSCCKHPLIENSLAPYAYISSLLFQMGKKSEIFPPLNVEADPHGVKMGWFMWPMNFDPIWLKNCDGYKEKENG